jgi:hypothetical protein
MDYPGRYYPRKISQSSDGSQAVMSLGFHVPQGSSSTFVPADVSYCALSVSEHIMVTGL